MSQESLDISQQDGQPIELYLFQNVENKFAYTSGQQFVSFNGNTYVPKPISRTDQTIEQTQDAGVRNLVIKLPLNDPLVLRYVNTLPASEDSFTLYRFQSTDGGTPEVIVFFKGTVSSVAFTGNEAKVNILSDGDVLNQTIPKQTCRFLCNHILYDNRCLVSDINFTMPVTVTAISAGGSVITVDGGAGTIINTGLQLSAQMATDPTYFNAGFVRRGGIEHRMVLTSTNLGGNLANLSILLPFETLGVGSSIDLFAGCDHNFTTCTTKFANTIRYGGFPFVPRKNVFQVGVTL